MADKLNEILALSRGIRKTFLSVSLAEYIRWLRAGEVVVEDWNRDEVEKRPGDANSLLESLAKGWSISMFLGHWDGILAADGRPGFTKENPLKVTEGGHRTRWIGQIASGEATLDGNNLDRIRELCPELGDKILGYKLRIELTTHQTGRVPLTYTKGEYKAINTLASPLTTGETLRASTDDNFIMLSDTLKDAFKGRQAKMDKMDRDKASEILAGLIQIIVGTLAGEGDPLKPSKEALVDLTPTDEIMPEALSVIAAVKDLEDWLIMTYGRTKGAKKMLDDAPRLEFYGPLVLGLTKAGEDRATAVASIKTFFKMSMDDDNWKVNSGRVQSKPGKGSNGGGRLNKKRYEHGWNQLLSIIAPSMPMTASDELVIEA